MRLLEMRVIRVEVRVRDPGHRPKSCDSNRCWCCTGSGVRSGYEDCTWPRPRRAGGFCMECIWAVLCIFEILVIVHPVYSIALSFIVVNTRNVHVLSICLYAYCYSVYPVGLNLHFPPQTPPRSCPLLRQCTIPSLAPPPCPSLSVSSLSAQTTTLARKSPLRLY